VKTPFVKFCMRFGRVVKSRGQTVLRPESGVHIRLPWEKVVVLNTAEKTLDLTKKFWPADPNARKPGLDVRSDGYLITGDANIVHTQLRARYYVRGALPEDAPAALAYTLQIKDAEAILEQVICAATCKVVASRGVMQVIKPETLFSDIKEEADRRIAEFERAAGCSLGLRLTMVEAIQLEDRKNPTEPGVVSEAFNRAQMAESERDQLRREGEIETSKILNAAMAEAKGIRERARADTVRRVSAARADAQQIQKFLPYYRLSPEVARILRVVTYQNMIERVMRDAPGTFILPRPSARTLLWLQHQKRPAQEPEPLMKR
jgi:regulator of protease activity HflC (stomatin/prohibitin superfamily)